MVRVVQYGGQLLVFYHRYPCDWMFACHRDVVQGMVPVPLGVVGDVYAPVSGLRYGGVVLRRGCVGSTGWRAGAPSFSIVHGGRRMKIWNGPTDRYM